MDAASSGLELEIGRRLPAARASAFAAFVNADQLAQWWGPHGFTSPSVDFDARVGASFRIEMQPPVGDRFLLTGAVRDVDPPARLAYTFVWEPPDPDDVETLVALAFRDLGDATEVVVRQGAFRTEARRALHRAGWTDALERLERLLGDAG